MRSIIGQCPDCCECPAPTVEWDSRSASKTKCGHPEFPGFTSDPPKRYLRLTKSGAITVSLCHACEEMEAMGCSVENLESDTWSGDCTYTCEPEGSVNSLLRVLTVKNCETSEAVSTELPQPCAFGFAIGYEKVAEGATSRTWNFPSPPCSEGGCFEYDGSVAETLTVEYTTGDLSADTEAALPPFDDDWNDTAGSYRNLTTNELTLSIREGKYRFRFKIPKVSRGACYRIEWVERFTPETGDPVDTDKDFQWDGATPEGYDPDDSETWPLSDEVTVAIPEANGTTTVVDVEHFCKGCE